MNAPDCLRPGGLALTAELLSLTDLASPADVLDAGCGTGATVKWLRDNGFAAWGVDVRCAAETKWLRTGDMCELPWPDACFDGYLAECSLSVCRSAAQALAEAWRVLRPGGWLLVADVYSANAAGPSFSLKEAATLAAWQRAAEAAGFSEVCQLDRSALWKPFVLEALWAGLELADLWCGSAQQEASGKMGYLLMTGRRPK